MIRNIIKTAFRNMRWNKLFTTLNMVGLATGQGSNPLYAEKPDFFFLKVVDAQIEFIRRLNGETDHLILYQNGQKVDGKKIK